jgi:hypothetical protein
MSKKVKRLTTLDKVRAQAKAAMPEVKRLVKKFGRRAVSACLKKIADYDKEVAKLSALKKEIAAREAKLK